MEKKAVGALKQELVLSQSADDPMGISSLDELERKKLNILRELDVSPNPSLNHKSEDRTFRLTHSLSDVQEVESEIATKKQRTA